MNWEPTFSSRLDGIILGIGWDVACRRMYTSQMELRRGTKDELSCLPKSLIVLHISKMDEPDQGKEPRTPLRSLPDSIQSLLGVNSNLTASWLRSVCCIIKDLQSRKSGDDAPAKSQKIDKMDYADWDDSDKNASLLEIQGELASHNAKLKELSTQRRQTLNNFLDLKGNIRVFCRIRPLLTEENYRLTRPMVTSDSSKLLLRTSEKKSKQYSFDKVFHPQSTQEEVFSEIEPVIKSALDGYNVCIFAYGQTGTGKTYSMEGTVSNPGLVPRGIQAIFEQALERNHEFQFSFSMLEIYMGGLRDLLVPRSTKQRALKAPCLSIQMNSIGGIEIENLVCVKVCNSQHVKRLYNLGKRSRSTAATNSNSNSSRSHCLICITITCSSAPERQRETNKIWMVDLGGSERLLKTQATGRRLEEGKAINLSLSALGDVISALRQKKSHVPYRNSKLTQVLRDSLGFDSKTLMFVHVSPKEEDLCETICSLGFATRVKSIHLESEESPEVKAKKELEMTKLEKKLIELEGEQKDLQREIVKLIEREKTLTGSDEHTEDLMPFAEELELNESVNLHSGGDSARASPGLPRFMKPTICSKKKTTSVHLPFTSTRKKPSIPSKVRRPSSVYAESVIFQERSTAACLSECGSEFSMPISHADQEHGGDDDTACSQGTSEYEIKQVILSENEKPPASSTTSQPQECFDNRESENKEKGLSIEDWLHLQNAGQSVNQTACGKRVVAVPSADTRSMCDQEEMESFSNGDSSLTNQETKDAKKIQNRVAREGIAACENQEEECTENAKGFLIVNKSSGLLTETPESRENRKSVGSCNNVDYSGPQQQEEIKEEFSFHFRKSRRTLFVNDPSSPTPHQPSEFKHSTIDNSKCHDEEQGRDWISWERIQALWVSALLGLGIHGLGLGCDFFHGLLL